MSFPLEGLCKTRVFQESALSARLQVARRRESKKSLASFDTELPIRGEIRLLSLTKDGRQAILNIGPVEMQAWRSAYYYTPACGRQVLISGVRSHDQTVCAFLPRRIPNLWVHLSSVRQFEQHPFSRVNRAKSERSSDLGSKSLAPSTLLL